MTTVYRKSAKGQHEIETRANRLAPRLRTALIVVDGRRSDVDLRTLIQIDPEATLLSLLEAGYIEIVAAESLPRASQAASSPMTGALPMAATAASSAASLAERRRLAAGHLTDQLGPLAESVALMIEKTRTWDELRPALELGQRLLQTARGGAAAARFADRFIETPPG